MQDGKYGLLSQTDLEKIMNWVVERDKLILIDGAINKFKDSKLVAAVTYSS